MLQSLIWRKSNTPHAIEAKDGNYTFEIKEKFLGAVLKVFDLSGSLIYEAEFLSVHQAKREAFGFNGKQTVLGSLRNQDIPF